MATNMFKKYTESKCREWPVPVGTQAGTVVIHPVSDQVGVTLTARGDSTTAINIPGITGGTIANGGAGNKANSATVAVDGSWLLAVAGVTDGDTNPATGTAGTPAGTAIFRVAADGTYALAGDAQIGVVDDGVIVGGVVPVLIGEVLP